MERIREENPNTFEYWNKTAIDDGFLKNLHHDKPKIVEAINKNITGTVLDVGAGSGMITKSLVADEISACDWSEPALKQLNTLGLKDVFYCDITSNCIFNPRSYDTVIATEVLEHFTNFEDTLYRIVSPARKKLIITVPNDAHGKTSREHVWTFTEDDIIEMMEAYGTVKTQIIDNSIFAVCTL